MAVEVPVFGLFDPAGGFAVDVAPGFFVVVTGGFFLIVVVEAGLVAGLLVGRDVLPPIIPPPVTPPSCCANAAVAQANRNSVVNTNRNRGVCGVVMGILRSKARSETADGL